MADGDVQMADATNACDGASASATLLDAVATGDLSALARESTTRSSRVEHEGAETERLLLTPFLPLLARLDHARSTSGARTTTAPHAISALLVRYEQVNVLREYARVFQSLQLADIERVVQQKSLARRDSTIAGAAALNESAPIYRKFENGDARERACLVLAEVYAHSVQSAAAPAVAAAAGATPSSCTASELFANAIYCDELAAILVHALASTALRSSTDAPFSLRAVVRFCLGIPLGVALLERVVQNDPSAIALVVDAVVANLADISDASAATVATTAATVATVGDASAALPVEYQRAQATCLALAHLAPAYATLVRDALSASSDSLWAVAVAFDVSVRVPALQRDLALFVFRMMKHEARVGAASGPAASVSAFSAYLSLALSVDPPELETPTSTLTHTYESPLQQVAAQHLHAVRQQLIASLPRATSPFDVVLLLNVLIGLIVQSHWRPSEHEAATLLRWFERAAQTAPQSLVLTGRVVSLAYVLVVLLCYPLAPSLNKIPSQRDDATKLVLALAQQCIFALYNTRAACPLFILSAVLLYTKSPSLLPFVASVIGNDGLSVQALRVDYLHVVGDVVLKPILTENIMAREVLTFAPAASTTNLLDEMTLRSIYGLLCEKSFLRHHHGRALEEWVAAQVARAALPLPPLLLNILLEWIENYVVAFEYPLAHKPVLQLSIIPLRTSTLAKWLRAPCLAQQFVSDSDSDLETARSWSRGVLALTYALQFNQRIRHAMMVTSSKISALSPLPPPSGGDVCLSYDVSEFPLRNVLRNVLAHSGEGEAFEFVAPTLLRLLVEEYPHRVDAALVPMCCSRLENTMWCSEESQQPLAHDASDWRAPQTWLRLSLALTNLATAPTRIVLREFDAVLQRVVPLLLLAPESAEPHTVSCEALFALIAQLYEHRVQHAHTQRAALTMQLVHTLCFPDLVRKHYAQRQQHAVSIGVSGSSADRHRVAPLSHLVTYSQVVEEPFRLLSDAHVAVVASPSLLRMLLLLVRDLRAAANAHLKKQDPVLAPRRQQLLASSAAAASDATGGGSSATLLVARTASMLQHMLVQDCLIIHALLQRLSAVTLAATADDDDSMRECTRVLCGAINALFDDNGDSAQSSALPPHRLIAAVHQQGYDSALVPVLVVHVPAMRALWDHWMAAPGPAPPNSSSAATASSTNARSSSTSSATAAQNRALHDFVTPDGAEKDLSVWAFRLEVFFALCGACFAPPTQTPAVLQTLRLVLNRVRSVLLAAIAASGGGSAAAGDSGDDARSRHAAFLDRVLPRAVAACAQHAELSAELVQFLLKLQKQSGGANRWKMSLPPSTSATSAATRDVATGSSKDLDDVLREAYSLLLEQI